MEPIASLVEPRKSAAGVQLNDSTYWITGGSNKESSHLSSTELITADFSSGTVHVSAGPTLPDGNSGHCIVKLNDTTVFLFGGSSPEAFQPVKNWFYDFVNDKWTEGPELNTDRQNAQCGLIQDVVTGTKIAIATGGVGYATKNSVSLWFEGSDEWISGNPMPYRFCSIYKQISKKNMNLF